MKSSMMKFFLAFVLVTSLVSCSKSKKYVPVKILLTDNPAVYDEVNVHIKGVQVNIHGDNEPWIDLPSKDTVINLLDLQNGVTMVLAEGNVPEGILKEVRFILGNDNYVVVNSISHELQAPNATSSGLKIKIDKKLGETMNSFVLDFDAALSVKEGNGNYLLSPVIKVK
jgi:hypothetical protein